MMGFFDVIQRVGSALAIVFICWAAAICLPVLWPEHWMLLPFGVFAFARSLAIHAIIVATGRV
jgi:hypothetical protein